MVLVVTSAGAGGSLLSRLVSTAVCHGHLFFFFYFFFFFLNQQLYDFSKLALA